MNSGPDLTPNEQLLESLAREPFLYCPNPGNAGDSVIASATFMAFDRAGCRYTVIDAGSDEARTAGKVVVYAGGGNLVPLYSAAGNFIARHHRQAKRLILLPHTIDGHPDLLRALGPNVQLVAREARSFRYARQQAPGAEVTLAHDMAFTLRIGELRQLAGKAFYPLLSGSGLKWRNTKRWIRIADHAIRTAGRTRELFAFRHDIERTAIRIPRGNVDVSQLFAADNMSARFAHEAAYRAFDFLDRFETIHTNRLHVCLMSLLLGKSVHLHANSYSKNLDIFEHSIRPYYKNVQWHG